ncbi:MAG TPA: BACON domain-containing carbohydrate-binding protein [Bryobacteraceae bacterium]|nr:BACON domain-containing carbohydrate-binding protein [Bryobacteraceae bacterium]
MKSAVPVLISIVSTCALAEGATGLFYQQASIAISGNVVLSGDGNTAIVQAAGLQVFTRSNGAWTFRGPIIVPGFDVSQVGTIALSADGNTLVASAHVSDTGGAVVLVQDNGSWTQQGVLIGTGASSNTQEGASLAISSDGNTVAMGGPYDSPTGAIWVFTRNNGAWSQQGGKLVVAGASTYLGLAVALSGDGNTLLIPDRYDSNNVGAGYIFTRSNGVWSQQGGKLTPSDPAGAPEMGTSVALSADGNTAILGGPSDALNLGASWVFVRVNGVWSQQGPKLAGAAPAGQMDQGQLVALSADGNTAAASAFPGTNSASAILVFTRTNSTWTQLGPALAGSTPGGRGPSLALSADASTLSAGGASIPIYAASVTPPAVTLTPTLAFTDSNGGLGSFSAAFASPGTSWTVSSNTSWLNVVSQASGSGNTTVAYSAAPNNSVASRTGTIVINGQTFTLVQNGVAPAFFLSPNTVTIAATGGTGTIAVTGTPPDAPWTAVSNASWITLVSGTSGAGNGTVAYSVAPDPLIDRIGTITIANQLFTITQTGASQLGSFSTSGAPWAIVNGPDGALWFTEQQSTIGRITTAGVVTEYSLSTPGLSTHGLTAGPDGALWFTAFSSSAGLGFIGRMTTTGTSTLYLLPSTGENALAITTGPDGALWFTEPGKIGRITTSGAITEYPVPGDPNGGPLGITSGPDGALWFTYSTYVGRMTTSGTVTQFAVPSAGVPSPTLGRPAELSEGIVTGPDGALWFGILGPLTPHFTCEDSSLGRLTTTGQLTVISLPNVVTGTRICMGSIGVTTGPDGSIWVADTGSQIAQVTTTGVLSARYPADAVFGITTGPDNALWFAGVHRIGRFPSPTASSSLGFHPLPPCRVLDTRGSAQGPLAANSVRDVAMLSSACSIPVSAQAYSLNVTVVPPAPLNFLTIWPTGKTQPLVSTLNSYDGTVVANAAIVPAGTNGDVNVYASDATDVIIDINGYFDGSTSNGLAYYPATPCRVADTRGGQALGGGQTRSFQISGACTIPASAQAYSLNMTAVPPGPLTYLSAWAAGQTQPLVSTLNSDGRIVANAAIVPAGTNGAVDVFASNPTDVVIDIDGYFAPPGGPDALFYYPVTPCRVADTRSGQTLAANSVSSFAMASTCGLPATAQAYSLNFTAVPPGPLLYLTTWAQGMPQPYVSTLNSPLGRVVANAALVPAGTNGGISVFVSDRTNLVIDTNGYFGHP